MWQQIPNPKRPRIPGKPLRKARLYADENIEAWIVQLLRDQKVNIKSAVELGHSGKDDSFHAALSFKDKRFLLTKNGKDFLDDRVLPFSETWGVIAFEVDTADFQLTATALHILIDVIGIGELMERSKVRLSAEEMSITYLHPEGKRMTQRFRLTGGGTFQWIEA